MIVKPRLRAPADVQACEWTCVLLHSMISAQLRPVVHLLKGQVLHRRAGDDQAVKVLVLHLVKASCKTPAYAPARCFSTRDSAARSAPARSARACCPSTRANCVSVSTLVGIRFRSRMRSGRISCVMARVSVITKMFSAGQGLGGRQLVGNLNGHRVRRQTWPMTAFCRSDGVQRLGISAIRSSLLSRPQRHADQAGRNAGGRAAARRSSAGGWRLAGLQAAGPGVGHVGLDSGQLQLPS